MKRNTQDLVVASQQTGVAVNAENTKCRFVSPTQHAGQSHNINTGNKSFERVGQFIRTLGNSHDESKFHP